MNGIVQGGQTLKCDDPTKHLMVAGWLWKPNQVGLENRRQVVTPRADAEGRPPEMAVLS